MSACACLGPPGNCPCLRRAAGLPVPITEVWVAPEIFALLPDADKNLINDLKVKALGLSMAALRNARERAEDPTPSPWDEGATR